MMRKLELDALRSDLNSVTRLLKLRTAETDPIGYFQFLKRRDELTEKINQLQNAPNLRGSIALFFSGGPVVGSKGVRADFAGKAIEIFQDLVSKQFAAEETGDIGQRGPVPMRANSDLLLTDIARGSVGLVLEEAGQNDTIVQTQLSIVLNHVADSISITTRQDISGFEELLERLDHRQLSSLRNFFQHLYDASATIRIVEGETDLFLDAEAIHRARDRTSAATIEERDDDHLSGRLYLLPGHRRFELHVDGNLSTNISGSVAKEFAREHLQDMQNASDVVGKRWRVRVQIRTVQRQNGEPKLTYMLKGLIEALD